MDSDIKAIVDRLTGEIKKDLIFFGMCGAIVGYFMILHSRLKEEGFVNGDGWANSLFNDFVSFNAFGFVFVGLIAIGSISTIALSCGFKWPRLVAVVEHLETRLAQISSAIISFTAGLSFMALLHAGLTISAGGILFSVLIVSFNGLLFVGFFTALVIARGIKPWGSLPFAILSLLMAIAALVWFIVAGIK
jgi:hypothetical protein